jgi:hypothetical protein
MLHRFRSSFLSRNYQQSVIYITVNASRIYITLPERDVEMFRSKEDMPVANVEFEINACNAAKAMSDAIPIAGI